MTKDIVLNIQPNWNFALSEEFEKTYFKEILTKLNNAEKLGIVIFPPKEKILRSLNLIDLNNVKVVIIGQDPYHGPGQANGFAFAVNPGNKIPPSLKNIFKELSNDLNVPAPTDPTLEGWAQQGVLMLNSVLTVEEKSPASHKDLGWQTFTNKIIEVLNKRKDPIIFILWGNFAQKMEILLTNKDHIILKAPHPSPFSAYTGFFGCKHFSLTNEQLLKANKQPIDWAKTGKY
jgi:uracil-DNA glycosylase